MSLRSDTCAKPVVAGYKGVNAAGATAGSSAATSSYSGWNMRSVRRHSFTSPKQRTRVPGANWFFWNAVKRMNSSSSEARESSPSCTRSRRPRKYSTRAPCTTPSTRHRCPGCTASSGTSRVRSS